MKIYDKHGYVNIRALLKYDTPFIFCVGGRGTGKTYTSLKTAVEDGLIFLLMRRTQQQVDLINKPFFTPFKKLNIDMGWDIITKPISKGNSAFYMNEKLIGYTAALSTISNIRGFDLQDVDIVIFDEFIPESHERPIKNEASAFFNAYETINRNRELLGKPPLKMLCLANSNSLDNPIFDSLGLIDRFLKMMTKDQYIYIDKERGIGVFLLDDSPISKAKKSTSLYKMVNGSSFSDMALKNVFFDADSTYIKSQNLKEYLLLFSVSTMSIYRHKSKDVFYVSSHRTGTALMFTSSMHDIRRVRKDFGWLYESYLKGVVFFESLSLKKLFEHMFA